MTGAPPQWRDTIAVHPAADLFPMMSNEELYALAADIKKNGLQQEIILWAPTPTAARDQYQLLDGRNRLEAMERAGVTLDIEQHVRLYCDKVDPYAFVISANIHRRHLTGEQKRELIAKLIKATPEKSDRQIADTVKADHKTVGTVRAEQEARGEIPHVETRTDTKGRKQPARKTINHEAKKFDGPAAIKALAASNVRMMSDAKPKKPKLSERRAAATAEADRLAAALFSLDRSLARKLIAFLDLPQPRDLGDRLLWALQLVDDGDAAEPTVEEAAATRATQTQLNATEATAGVPVAIASGFLEE
jgi:ParB-like nuclease domain